MKKMLGRYDRPSVLLKKKTNKETNKQTNKNNINNNTKTIYGNFLFRLIISVSKAILLSYT